MMPLLTSSSCTSVVAGVMMVRTVSLILPPPAMSTSQAALKSSKRPLEQEPMWTWSTWVPAISRIGFTLSGASGQEARGSSAETS